MNLVYAVNGPQLNLKIFSNNYISQVNFLVKNCCELDYIVSAGNGIGIAVTRNIPKNEGKKKAPTEKVGAGGMSAVVVGPGNDEEGANGVLRER